jgi:hypothetical protein
VFWCEGFVSPEPALLSISDGKPSPLNFSDLSDHLLVVAYKCLLNVFAIERISAKSGHASTLNPGSGSGSA